MAVGGLLLRANWKSATVLLGRLHRWSTIPPMRSIAVCVVLALALAGCGGSSSDDGDASPNVASWPEEIRDNFSAACVVGAEASGADSGEAEDYCACVLSELESRYTAEEFAEAEQKMLNGEATDLDMLELGEICLS